MKKNLIKAINNPRKAIVHLYEQFAKRTNTSVHNIYSNRINKKSIFESDWDNLILLDGCRYDLIKSNYFPNKTIQACNSRGSHTVEFLSNNINGQYFGDTVWVSGNPQLAKFEDKIYSVEHVWKDAWDEKHRTVMPDQMYERALDIQDAYPNKRLVIHFVQPHYPFVGESAQELCPDHATFRFDEYDIGTDSEYNIWQMLKQGKIEQEAVWQSYRENLEVALPFVRKLTNELHGTTVVSSDHGNAFGDWTFPVPFQIYGHPSGFFSESLRKVPWIVFDNGERKSIRSENKKNQTQSNSPEKEVYERLQDLGYMRES